jgi:hypothetical protein
MIGAILTTAKQYTNASSLKAAQLDENFIGLE